MRIGGAWGGGGQGYYRVGLPLETLAERGHDVVWPEGDQRHLDVDRLATCDVVHVYRRLDEQTRYVVGTLIRKGVAVTWDNDDNLGATPEESPLYKTHGGAKGARIFRDSVRIAKRAQIVTVPNETLATLYRENGIERIEVIPNSLPVQTREARPHVGIVIGWIAGLEHRADAGRLGIAATLERVLEAHPEVRVECIGVDLGLSERYRHDEQVRFFDLPKRMAGWDIGIAPLADIPFNRSRSDIKLKEYAATGVPWLASSLTPYQDLGPEQGGLLVPDDGWLAALERLIVNAAERRELAENARAWAATQTIADTVGRWEAVFEQAVDRCRASAR